MAHVASRWKRRVLAFALSSLLVFCLFGAAELFCRLFLNINLRKTSSDFVLVDDNGFVYANAPNASGVSFGEAVFSDPNGFRIPEGYKPSGQKPAILLVGDSVTFGVGVPEPDTFAGRLRSALPDKEILNSGVIGFSLPDYVRVTKSVLASRPNVERVYLYYCLNDFHSPDVYQIKANSESIGRILKRGASKGFEWINDFLGPRSKFYVLLTGLTIDPSWQYYENDRRSMDVDDQAFVTILSQLVEIARMCSERNIEFTVVLDPYEMQVRTRGRADFSPQERIIGFLESRGVRVIDTRQKFLDLDDPSSAFLFADPMHLSSLGHKLVFESTLGDLNK